MEPIILASTSARRQDILKSLGIPFRIMTPDYAEPFLEGITPRAMAETHAIRKVEAILKMDLRISIPWVLGADTLICLDGAIFGKPANRTEAKSMLESFSGKTHEVITSICLFDDAKQYISSRTNVSTVTFMDLDAQQIEQYLDTGEWQGVAGGYRIQGLAACFITKIEGSWSGIVGLPIHDLYAILREHGYAFEF